MPRALFERHLHELKDELIIMGSMVEKSIARAIDALNHLDFELAEQVIQGDKKINQQRNTLEESCVAMIAQQQPMASDLRVILSVMSIVTDLERIGDYAAGISEITLLLRDDLPFKSFADISRMADIGMEMLRSSLKAFVEKDEKAARAIALHDDEIDALYHKVLQQCIAYMSQDPKNITAGTRIIWVAHKLERIGDRVTNICERVVFTTTGKLEELDK